MISEIRSGDEFELKIAQAMGLTLIFDKTETVILMEPSGD
jgi:hypothetical protein